MGNISVHNSKPKQKYLFDTELTEKDQKVLQFRSNPTLNQFIPKVFLQYEDQQHQETFLNECKINKNLPIGIRFEKFIGNLTLLKGKLRFQQTLYVLKSLLTGYEVILSFFGKVVVSENFCFVTKEGQVKAWINNDFRKNSFETSNEKCHGLVANQQKLFLRPEQWIDQNQKTSSIANIIKSILAVVSDLTYETKEFQSFIHKVNVFILENILKNYDFTRIARFTNKFIYQKKLFVKSNLLEAIQRIYEDHLNQHQTYGLEHQSQVDERVKCKSPQNQSVKRQEQNQCHVTNEIKLRKYTSGRQSSGRSFTYNDPHIIKKSSTFFESNLNSNCNTKPSTVANSNIDNFKDHVSSSKCSSHTGNYTQFQTKSSQRRNHISPQYSYNQVSVTNNAPNINKKVVAVLSTPKSSIIASKNSFINRNNSYVSNENTIKVITQPKQTSKNEQKPIEYLRIQAKCPNTNCNRNSFISINDKNLYVKNQSQVKFQHLIKQNKVSTVSIQQNMEGNFNFKSQNQPRMFNSNCFQSNQDFTHRNKQFVSLTKKSHFHKNSILEKSQTNFNNFTMKTITKLISSNGDISDQQESLGDFPSNQNISNYSGILASMGRSAQIIQVPSEEKIALRNEKKMKTMFFNSSNCPNKNTFMSANIFQTH